MQNVAQVFCHSPAVLPPSSYSIQTPEYKAVQILLKSYIQDRSSNMGALLSREATHCLIDRATGERIKETVRRGMGLEDMRSLQHAA